MIIREVTGTDDEDDGALKNIKYKMKCAFDRTAWMDG